jgi:hypothetical protein
MGNSEYIAIAGVFAVLLSVLVTWLIMKHQFASKKLSYVYTIDPILRNIDPHLARDLKVSYQDEDLPEPTILNLQITNTGFTAVENAKVVVQLPGATYLIPGYFTDIPTGYEDLWSIERTDAEECTIMFKHINPKQIARIRLLMDEMPKGEPKIFCPMPNVEFTKINIASLSVAAKLLIKALAPQVWRALVLK